MDSKQLKKIDGLVKEALPNTMFRVALDDGRDVLATLKGVLRRKYTRVVPGDRVQVEMTPYDEKRGRISRKYR